MSNSRYIWRSAYVFRLVERGLSTGEAWKAARGVLDEDCEGDPAQAADDELSYWAEASGG